MYIPSTAAITGRILRQRFIYGVSQCDEFASGPFVVGNLSLRDDAGRLIDMEREVHWNLTTRKPCGGVTTVVNATTVTIEHNKRTQH